jgi:hypothetical protein
MTLLGDSYCEYSTDITHRLPESSVGSHDAQVAKMLNRDLSLHEIQSTGPIVRSSRSTDLFNLGIFAEF